MTEILDYRSPWEPGWRNAAWSKIGQPWDILIVGGGIVGAGLLNAAARRGLAALLLEQNDFASGASGRTSRLVHGGLRYLKRMQFQVTRRCVRERQALLQSAPGLVEPLDFIYPSYGSDTTRPWMIRLGLALYTRMAAGAGSFRELKPSRLLEEVPGLASDGLTGGFLFQDAQTDDARLVLRVLHDGLRVSKGRCAALNYARVRGLLFQGGRVAGVDVQDVESGRTREASAAVVINATGAWVDRLRMETGAKPGFRPLRGSHLFFPRQRLPVSQAVMFEHPQDGRPIFVIPWEGITQVGTTDVDHALSMDDEPAASGPEGEYLLRAVQVRFPEMNLSRESVQAAQAGVRCVVGTGKADPSAESREHAVLEERGLLTVAGGKLTTFGLMAAQTLQQARRLHPRIPPETDVPLFEPIGPDRNLPGIDQPMGRRLWGRYGRAAAPLVENFPHLLHPIEGTPYLWAELAWAARSEAVAHVEDLFLRRLRLGLLLEDGGRKLLPQAKEFLCGALQWDEARWTMEIERYLRVWRRGCGTPWSCP